MKTNQILTDTRFFVSINFLQNLNDEKAFKNVIGSNFCFDVIEIPYHCKITSTANVTIMEMFSRNEIGFSDHASLDAEICKNEHDDSCYFTLSPGATDEGDRVRSICLLTAEALCSYAKNNDLSRKISNIDIDTEGFYVEERNGKLVFNKVSGKARPSLTCFTLFGRIELRRPYTDEVLEEIF